MMAAALGPVMWFNHTLFLSINGLHAPVTDRIWLGFTTLGDGFLIGIFLGAFLMVNPRVAIFGIVLLLLSTALIHAIKICLPSLRPVMVLNAVHVVGPVLKSGSFPSGHAAAAMSLGLALAKFSSFGTVRVVAISIAALVGISRVFVGAHFPADVLAGMMCSTFMSIVLDRLIWPAIEYRIPARPSFETRPLRMAFYIEVLASVYAVSVYSCYFAEVPWVGALVSFMILLFLAAGCFERLRVRR